MIMENKEKSSKDYKKVFSKKSVIDNDEEIAVSKHNVFNLDNLRSGFEHLQIREKNEKSKIKYVFDYLRTHAKQVFLIVIIVLLCLCGLVAGILYFILR